MLVFDLSLYVAALLLALWLAKDVAMYPLVRIAYEDASPDATESLIGATGTARDRIDPEGWVQVGSELWRAELAPGAAPVEGGAPVRVVSVHGLTLDVEAA